jgi:hypothetical protein
VLGLGTCSIRDVTFDSHHFSSFISEDFQHLGFLARRFGKEVSMQAESTGRSEASITIFQHMVRFMARDVLMRQAGLARLGLVMR